MLELMYTWQLVQVKYASKIPIILFGNVWEDFIKWIKKGPLKNEFMDKDDLALLYHAKNCADAMKIIKKAFEEHKKGSKNIFPDIKKYKVK